MLKKFFWVLLFGSLISCQTDPLEPDPIIPPPVTKYTITAEIIGQVGSVSPSTIDVIKGSGVSFSLTLPLGYDPSFITVNGVKSPLTNTTYSFSPNSNSKLVFEIKMNRFGLLIWKPWKGFLQRERYVGSTEWAKDPADNFVFKSFIFGNERFSLYNSFTILDATTKIGDGPYLLTNDSLLIGFNPQGLGGIRNKVDVLTGDTLRMRAICKFYGTPKLPDSEIECTYIH